MKKNTIKAFTLVEMLIVIVIIGILIAALMPRMQAAQWRARDVSRKTALSQIQSAIVVSQWDKWAWPGMPKNNQDVPDGKSGTSWLNIVDIKSQLEAAWLNWIPEDPLNAEGTGLGDKWTWWQYRYMVLDRNGTPAWWFILMAKTEVEWWSNWVYCESWSSVNPNNLSWWKIDQSIDLKSIVPCTSISKRTGTEDCGKQSDWTCRYDNDGQLRYIITY